MLKGCTVHEVDTSIAKPLIWISISNAVEHILDTIYKNGSCLNIVVVMGTHSKKYTSTNPLNISICARKTLSHYSKLVLKLEHKFTSKQQNPP